MRSAAYKWLWHLSLSFDPQAALRKGSLWIIHGIDRHTVGRHHCKLLLVCILRIIMHFSPCPVSQAEQPSRWLGMAAPPLHAMEREQQKLLSKGNRLCVILHPNDKSKLESNLFLKTSFFLYYLLWAVLKKKEESYSKRFYSKFTLSMVWSWNSKEYNRVPPRTE